MKGDRRNPDIVNDVIRCTLLFRGISLEDINNSTQEEIYLLMAYDVALQKRDAERMKQMFGGQ